MFGDKGFAGNFAWRLDLDFDKPAATYFPFARHEIKSLSSSLCVFCPGEICCFVRFKTCCLSILDVCP